MFSLRDMLRYFYGGDKKQKPAFKSEREAYDFCKNLYNKSGGVTPELRRAYEFYQKNLDDGCGEFFGPQQDQNFSADIQRPTTGLSLR